MVNLRKATARELVETIRRSVTIDWSIREDIRAQLRVYVKRILSKHGCPPDKQEKAAHPKELFSQIPPTQINFDALQHSLHS